MKDSITKMCPTFCQPVLPAAFDDSLSYMELLCKLKAKLNELIEKFNLIDIGAFATKEELREAIAELDTTLRELLERSQAEQTVMLKAHTIAKIGEAVDYLQAQIDNVTISNVMMVDPEDSYGRRTVQEVAYRTNQNYRTFADAVTRFDTLDYDASVRDGMEVEAYAFDMFSTFFYSMGMLESNGVYDGNYAISGLKAILNDAELGTEYVKKHDILAYYFNRKADANA